MIKKQLMALALPELTEKMIERAKSDRVEERRFRYWAGSDSWFTAKSYATRLYYAAREEDGILIVSVWSREMIVEDKRRQPAFTCYIDPEKAVWQTFDGRMWSGALLENVIERFDKQRLTNSRAEDVCGRGGTALCRRILGEIGDDIPGVIIRWQRDLREKQNRQRAQKRKDYWDSRMAMIPPIPDGFEDWADKEGTWESNFIFFRKAGKSQEAYCTRCDASFTPNSRLIHSNGQPDDYRYSTNASFYCCPSCGKILSTKSWNKQKHITTSDGVTLVQAVEGEVVLRHFRVKKHFQLADDLGHLLGKRDWEHTTQIYEDMRVFADPQTFESRESYREETIPYLRGCHWRSKKEMMYMRGKYIREAPKVGDGRALYQDMDEIIRMSGIPGKLIRICRGDRINSVQTALIRAGRKRYLEYLYRSGLTKLADDIIKKDRAGLAEDAKDLKTLLGIDGQQLRLLKEINGGADALKVIKWIGNEKARVDRETLLFMIGEGIDPDSLPLEETGMSLQRMVNYLRKQAKKENVPARRLLRTYMDYLSMAERRGMDLHDEIVSRTPRLRELHDRYAAETEDEKNLSRDNSLDIQYRHIQMDYEENKKHFEYKRDGMIVVIPKRPSEITAEGRMQHHCVGATDTYIKSMDRRESFILFLRHEDAVEKPYYTLEVRYDGHVLQAYGEYNRKPDKAKVDAFLASFTRQIGKRTKREKEGAEAGRALISPAV